MHVLVVGAGASGLCSAKHALEIFEKEETLKVTVVEKTQNVGGIWSSSDSPVYTNLHTNLPKELMAFPEFPFPPSEKSFVHHDKMASYLEAYAREYELQKHIRLGWEVVKVAPEKVDDGKIRWHVGMMEVTTGSKKYELADLLMICSGVREHSPRVPESSTKFTGDQMHSSEYRQADDPRFMGKTVMLAGGGPSGLDIASELSDVAQKVILSRGRGGLPVNGNLANKIEMVGGIKSIDGNIVIVEGQSKPLTIDCIIWCTGYDKNIPFLEVDCGIRVIEEGHVVDPLYMHVINIEHPTMAILHLNTGNVPFPHMEMQAKFFLTLHRENKVPLRQDMFTWLENDLKWRKQLGMPERHKTQGSG